MGSCHSRQPSEAVVITAGKDLLKPTVECRQGPDSDLFSLAPSLTSHTTGITRDSSELEAAELCLSYKESDPIPEQPIATAAAPSFKVPLAPIPSSVSSDSSHSSGSMIRRNKSGIVKDYLQAEGAACNRIMVNIETPFGIQIEEVYSDVHTGVVLGEGIAGKVRLITHRDTGIKRAVKRLDLTLVLTDEDMDRLLDEIKIMCCLDHPNVVCLEEVFEGENELFLTQELCVGGDLFDRLDKQPDFHYTEAGCARLIKQIISSVSYLHSKDIVHRDLKLENFLFQDDSNVSELKMIDFGLSKHFVEGEVQHEAVGTPYTVAPEVILGEGYDEKCDVWGIGVIAYLLLRGETPFGGDCEGDDLNEVKENILSGHVSFDDPIWHNVSDEAIGFIKSLLVLDPEKRPSASKLKDHPWLKSMKRNSSLESDESLSLSPKVVDQLVSFKSLSTTKKFLREIISYTLQPEQISGLHAEFEKIDVDDKGEISLRCFKEALIANSDQHPLTEVEIEEIFNGLKVRNTDLSIRWHEFIAACLSQCHIDERNIRLAFDRLDHERKGFLSLTDLRNAMEFYGSSSPFDLQSMWINSVVDYKSDKQHMTYDDFYRLLTLDKDSECSAQTKLLSKSAPPQHMKNSRSLGRSFISTGFNPFKDLDKKNLDSLATPVDTLSQSDGTRCRRHSVCTMHNLDMSKILLDDKEPSLISNIRASRDIHEFILEASKRVEEENMMTKKLKRKSSLSGAKGLFLRRESQERPLIQGI